MLGKLGQERFWTRVDMKLGDGCWEWTGARHRDGYGQVKIGGRVKKAHRVAWALANGPIPSGGCVLHSCDNRACVRPSHLFLGTHSDNMADMAAKGRAVSPTAKLTQEDVQLIKGRLAVGHRQVDIAHDFGVSQSQISHIRRGVNWAA
jgi:hypothetical protein